jgi:hypothetical protein
MRMGIGFEVTEKTVMREHSLDKLNVVNRSKCALNQAQARTPLLHEQL